MEHSPAPTPTPEHEAPKDALDTEMDFLDDMDGEEGDLAAAEAREQRIRDNVDLINDTTDAALDMDDDEYAPLMTPAEIVAAEEKQKKAEKDAAEREAKKKTPEQAALDAEKERRDQLEATLTLEGSQKLEQFVLTKADSVMKFGEATTAKVGNAKFSVKDAYQQWRVDGVRSKKTRYENKAQRAVFARRRKKFAEKARAMERRLTTLRGFQAADRDMHATNFAKYKYEEGKAPELISKGARTERREARAAQLQTRINTLVATEYKFAKLGRESRKQDKMKMKGEGNPQEREKLRRLIVESSSVGSLEAIGRKVFVDRLMSAPFVNENVRNAAMRSMQQFEEAKRNNFAA